MSRIISGFQGMSMWLILITLLIFTSGCKTIDYSPRVFDMPTEAMRVIYQTLEEQQDDHTPFKLEVTETKITVLYSGEPLWLE